MDMDNMENKHENYGCAAMILAFGIALALIILAFKFHL